jgi:hypothetical protein
MGRVKDGRDGRMGGESNRSPSWAVLAGVSVLNLSPNVASPVGGTLAWSAPELLMGRRCAAAAAAAAAGVAVSASHCI